MGTSIKICPPACASNVDSLKPRTGRMSSADYPDGILAISPGWTRGGRRRDFAHTAGVMDMVRTSSWLGITAQEER